MSSGSVARLRPKAGFAVRTVATDNGIARPEGGDAGFRDRRLQRGTHARAPAASVTSVQQLFSAIISEVRSRWRFKLLMRGTSAWRALPSPSSCSRRRAWSGRGSARRRFSPAASASPACLAACAWWFLVRPLRRRVTDEQVAMYLEEHEPSLQAILISAVEASRHGQAGVGGAGEQGRASRRSSAAWRPMRRAASSGCRCAAMPRHSASSAWSRCWRCSSGQASCATPPPRSSAFSSDIEAFEPYRITVTPGNRQIHKGADQPISARARRLRRGRRRRDVTPRSRCEVGTAATDSDGQGRLRRHAVRRRRRRSSTTSTADGGKVSSPHYTLIGGGAAVRAAARDGVPAIRPTPGSSRRRSRTPAAILPPCAARRCSVHIFPTMKTPGGRLSLNDKETIAADAAARRIADRRVQRRQAGVLPRRSARAERRARAGVAAVHDRRARRQRADRVVQAAGARHERVVDRRGVRRGGGARTTTASAISSWCTR